MIGRLWGLSLPLLCHRPLGHAFSKVGEKAAVAASTAEEGYGACGIWAEALIKCHLPMHTELTLPRSKLRDALMLVSHCFHP